MRPIKKKKQTTQTCFKILHIYKTFLQLHWTANKRILMSLIFFCSALLFLLQLIWFGYLVPSSPINIAKVEVRGVAGYLVGFHVMVVARETTPLVPMQQARPLLQMHRHRSISLTIDGKKAKQLCRKFNTDK